VISRSHASLSAIAIWISLTLAAVSMAIAASDKPVQGGISCAPGSVTKAAEIKKELPLILDRSSGGELAFWNSIKQSTDANSFLAYITNFPNGMFVDPAIEKYRSLCGNVASLPAALLMCSIAADPVIDKCRAVKRLNLLGSAQKFVVPGNIGQKSDLTYWNAIKDSADADAYLIYVTHFPNALFTDTAVEKYRRSCGDMSKLPAVSLMCQVSLPPPPPPPPPVVKRPPPIHHPPIKLPPVKRPPPPPPNTGACAPPFDVFGNCGGHSSMPSNPPSQRGKF